jgi:beta-glucosidase
MDWEICKPFQALALNAGIDMDMVGEGFLTTLKKSWQEKNVTQKQIDDACRRILEAKYKLGLFDDPYRYGDEKRASEIYTDANRKTAREIAADCFVLLKNQNNVLPLKKSGTIALIGPLADAKENMPGTWSVAADFSKAISVLQGLNETVGNKAKLLYAKGSFLDDDTVFEQRAGMFGKAFTRDGRTKEQLLQEALNIATQSDVVVAAFGRVSRNDG